MSRTSVLIIGLLTGMVCGVLAGAIMAGMYYNREGRVTASDTVTVVGTYIYKEPAARDSVQTKFVTRYLPVVRHDTIITEQYTQNHGDTTPPLLLSDERDSTAVEIPITQKRYEGEDYRAYVSGYEARLDSIYVFRRTTTIRERESKPPGKWHIGITGGFGYGFKQKGVEPFVGVGITYSIISF